MADGLIQQRSRIAGRAFGGAGDQRQRIVGNFRTFGGGNFAQQSDHHFGFDPAQVKPLATGQHRHWNLADFRGCEDEFHMLRRFFQRLQQRVERPGREHVHFVDDVDFVAGRGGAVMHRINDLANVGDAGVGCGVHLDHIDVSAFHDGGAMLALAARLCCGTGGAVCTNAVHALGNDPCGGGFAGAANTGHDEGLRNPVCRKRVLQRAHHCFLPHQIGKGFGAVFAGEHAIGGGVGHEASIPDSVREETRLSARNRKPLSQHPQDATNSS